VTARLNLPALVQGLRLWTRSHDQHVRAAVELLIAHDVWLRRPQFRACLHADRTSRGIEVWVDWVQLREAFDSGGFARASSTERAVLDLAIALGTDRYRLRGMGPETGRLVARAVAAAVGQPVGGAR
jgi:hypothetical protein